MVVSSAGRFVRAGAAPVRHQTARTGRRLHRSSPAGAGERRPARLVFQGAGWEKLYRYRRRDMAFTMLRTRFVDDQDLVCVKLMLLAGLLGVTAMLERVV